MSLKMTAQMSELSFTVGVGCNFEYFWRGCTAWILKHYPEKLLNHRKSIPKTTSVTLSMGSQNKKNCVMFYCYGKPLSLICSLSKVYWSWIFAQDVLLSLVFLVLRFAVEDLCYWSFGRAFALEAFCYWSFGRAFCSRSLLLLVLNIFSKTLLSLRCFCLECWLKMPLLHKSLVFALKALCHCYLSFLRLPVVGPGT